MSRAAQANSTTATASRIDASARLVRPTILAFSCGREGSAARKGRHPLQRPVIRHANRGSCNPRIGRPPSIDPMRRKPRLLRNTSCRRWRLAVASGARPRATDSVLRPPRARPLVATRLRDTAANRNQSATPTENRPAATSTSGRCHPSTESHRAVGSRQRASQSPVTWSRARPAESATLSRLGSCYVRKRTRPSAARRSPSVATPCQSARAERICTSMSSSAFGGTAPLIPRSLYARCGATRSRRVPPMRMPATP